MQTLGLASEIKPTDGLMKRLFWPAITNQYDVDLVGQQGFWVCVVVAVLSLVVLVATGNILLGLVVGFTYFLAGLGVRERSIAAAVMIFLCYFLSQIVGFEMMYFGKAAGNPLLGLVAMMLLFANVRATVLSQRWQDPATDPDVAELPERSVSSWTEKMANRLPALIWPKLRYLFYPLGGILLALSILSVVAVPINHHKAMAKASSSSLGASFPE